VGRYISGLLQGLSSLEPVAGFSFQPLFGPRAVAFSARPGAGEAVRRLAKRVPFAYALAEASRAVSLETLRRNGLSLYHETNHAAPRFRGPVVLTIHDLVTLLYPETQERARARHFARALLHRARDATRIIVPTEAIGREVVQHLGVAPERVRAIHHGVDAHFVPAPSPREGPLLCVGALDPRKGLLTLLEAYDALPARLSRAHPLVLAGPAGLLSPELARRLRARRDGSLILTGYLSDPALLSLFREAALFCLPSSYEGFGLPLAEALACGLPAVASDDPALLEVSQGAALHFPRGDAQALSAALERALEDPGLREELARRGPERARHFSWARSAAEHLAVYREAAALDGRAR